MKNLRCPIIVTVIGAVILALGLTAYLVMPLIIHNQVSAMLPLKNGTMIYDQWQNTTVPAYLQFWFYSVLNPLEVLKGDKPSLAQIGPYTYRERRVKHNISFDDNGFVSYLQTRSFYFDRSLSIGTEDDTITTINIPLVVIADKVKHIPYAFKKLAEAFVKTLEKNGVFFTTSVRNITWGYFDPLLNDIDYLVKLLKPFGIHFYIDPLIGLFAGKNNSDDRIYVVDTGTVNLDNFLRIRSWNGSSSLSMWHDRYANMVNGTDGSMFGPFLNASSLLYIFQSDICRSIYASYIGRSVVKGIPSIDFAAPDILFANRSVNPANGGFCLGGVCLGAGVLNLSACVAGGAPVVMSQPQFYAAASKYGDAVVGLTPSSDCKTLVQLEPTTGLPLRLQKKLQINIAVEPVASFMGMDALPTVTLPVMWLNESALIDDGLAGVLRQKLVLPVAIAHWLAVALIAVGALLCVVGLVAIAVAMARRRSRFHKSSSSPQPPLLVVNDDDDGNKEVM